MKTLAILIIACFTTFVLTYKVATQSSEYKCEKHMKFQDSCARDLINDLRFQNLELLRQNTKLKLKLKPLKYNCDYGL